jgi:hypothetical protein
MKYRVFTFFLILVFPLTIFAQVNSNSIKDQILDKTPEWLSKPVIKTVEKTELFRKEYINTFSSKKEEISNEIRKIEKLTPEERNKEWLVYLYFFIISAAKFLFESQLLFYAVILVLIAVISRFIYSKIF